MKPKKLSSIGMGGFWPMIQVSTCAALAVCLSGCASSSYKKADAASASQQKAAFEINVENRAIDSAMAALDDLVNKPNNDLRPQFDHYNAAVDNLIAASKRAEKTADRADKKSQAYFQTWDKRMASIHYEAVRDQSMSRKTEVANQFNTVDQRYIENQGVVEPLISYLRDIRTALSTDLTAGGIESVKPLVENARQNAQKVQGALAQLSDDWSASSARMSSLVVQDAQPRGGVGDPTQSTEQRAQSAPQ